MTKIIFFNGPPGSGKDTAVEALGLTRSSFADDLKDRFDRAFGITERPEGADKDLPLPFPFEGVTYRQGLIAFSEKLMKPLFGEDIFGKLLLTEIIDYEALLEIESGENVLLIGISDSGFAPEGRVLTEHYGKENCCVVQLWREGKDFSKDSRGYINHKHLGAALTIIMNNDSSIEVLKERLSAALMSVGFL
jgi:hypothetical protein